MSKRRMRYSGIGGQAVIEGVMMKNQNRYAVAVRKPDKKIEVDVQNCINTSDNNILSWPIIRGVAAFVDSLVLGIKSLTYSASFFEDEEYEAEESKFDKWLENRFGEKAENVIMGVIVLISVCVSIGLFMMLPLFIADLAEKFIPFVTEAYVPVIEGIAKVIIFIGYLLLISQMKDIKRTFMYHGAEHKCINCIESGLELNVENVRISSRQHKRCGTSFLFLVVIISIIFFIFIRTDIVWLRYVIRILLVPVIAGVSYEFIKLAGRNDSLFVRIVSAPGLLMQKITTSEPTDDMIEVAIASVEAVFDWRKYLRENGIQVSEPDDNYVHDEYTYGDDEDAF
jgi:uncharacterized protein YqhQ